MPTINDNTPIQVTIAAGTTIKPTIVSGGRGKSAYEVWLGEGHTGTEQDFLDWLKQDDYIHPSTHPASMIVESTDRQFMSEEEKYRALTTFVHNQMSASKVWTINHDFDRFPSVFCFDTQGRQIIGSIEYVSMTQIVVTFSALVSGKAYLN